jgi:hypothetical protein
VLDLIKAEDLCRDGELYLENVMKNKAKEGDDSFMINQAKEGDDSFMINQTFIKTVMENGTQVGHCVVNLVGRQNWRPLVASSNPTVRTAKATPLWFGLGCISLNIVGRICQWIISHTRLPLVSDSNPDSEIV